jgi:hypothetical protein
MMSCHYPTLDGKVALISDYADEARLSQRKFCGKYKVLKGAVYNILQRKDEYKHDFQSNANKNVKRELQDESGHKIDDTIFSLFVSQRAKNIALSRLLIQKKGTRDCRRNQTFTRVSLLRATQNLYCVLDY